VKRAIAIAILVAVAAAVAHTVSKEPHGFSDNQCLGCHTDPEGSPRALRRPVTELCVTCHSVIMKSASHPFDIKPRIASVPPDLPLEYGYLTCNTCHNVHAEATVIFGIKSHFLRRAVSDIKDFCLACHEDNLQRPGHKELFIVAHEANKYVETNPAESIDPLSAECIGCHDGSIGPAADYSLGSGFWMHEGSGHPIGVNYRRARMTNGGLRPMAELNPSVRFFEGKIGCAPCHDWFSSESMKLVAVDGGNLCVECHFDK